MALEGKCMGNLKRTIARIPVVGTISLFLYRCLFVTQYIGRPFKALMLWLFKSKEYANFTYDLTATNQRYLAAMIAEILNQPYDTVLSYIAELNQDVELKRYIADKIRNSSERYFADENIMFCRRIGWYALARAAKPRLIIETGVDKGLGSCVLIRALMHNTEEGQPGYYYGTDINPEAGYLLDGKYKEFGKILYGDSIDSLKKLDQQVDLFINDSDHSADYEEREYETIHSKLSPNAIVLGDNSHVTDKLINYSLKFGRQFLFFKEEPANHWYPGAGIGISFKRIDERVKRIN